MPLNDQTPATTLYNSSEVEVGTVASPLFTSDRTTGTLNNGAETAVGAAAVSVLAANANRRGAIIQNTGLGVVRVGVAGVTATSGVKLSSGDTVVFNPPFVVTSAIFAIRDGAVSSTVLAQEIT